MTSDLQRWSREVAEHPGSSSFVRLARAYRRQGRREAARNVVLGGLRANPHHVGGHTLLALLHIEAGEHESARDEWETALRLAPDNFDASRGLGYLALERGDLPQARRHLETARRARPEDPAVQQALEVLVRREGRARAASETTPGPAPTLDPGPDREPAGSDETRPAVADADPVVVEADPVVADAEPVVAVAEDPTELFADLAAARTPLLGAVLLDARGLVLAGKIDDGDPGQDDLLGGLLSSAVTEAARTARVMGLGRWEGLLMETDRLLLHVRALEDAEDGATVVVATRPGTPTGWVLRAARQARDLAVEYLRGARI